MVLRPGQGERASASPAAAPAMPATNSPWASKAKRSAARSVATTAIPPKTRTSRRRSAGVGAGSGPSKKASRAAASTTRHMSRPDAVM